MSPSEMWAGFKARIDPKTEYLVITSIDVTRDSVEALGPFRITGCTLFSEPLNQGFHKPWATSKRHLKCLREVVAKGVKEGQATEEDVKLLEACPILSLGMWNHGPKGLGLVLGLIDAGVHLDCQVRARAGYGSGKKDHLVYELTSMSQRDKVLLDKFQQAERRAYHTR